MAGISKCNVFTVKHIVWKSKTNKYFQTRNLSGLFVIGYSSAPLRNTSMFSDSFLVDSLTLVILRLQRPRCPRACARATARRVCAARSTWLGGDVSACPRWARCACCGDAPNSAEDWSAATATRTYSAARSPTALADRACVTPTREADHKQTRSERKN